MEFHYGQGVYIEGQKRFEGEIVLSEHKLFLKDAQKQDIAPTFIPLEKIEKVKKAANTLEIHVRPNLYIQYVASFRGDKTKINELCKDIVQGRLLKKRFLKNEWVEDPS